MRATEQAVLQHVFMTPAATAIGGQPLTSRSANLHGQFHRCVLGQGVRIITSFSANSSTARKPRPKSFKTNSRRQWSTSPIEFL